MLKYGKTVLIVLILSLLAACAPESFIPTEEPATEAESFIPAPNYNELPDQLYSSFFEICGEKSWINQLDLPKYDGFEIRSDLLPGSTESRTRTWHIYVKQITINDRVVDLPERHVSSFFIVDERYEYGQELNPEIWLAKADELVKSAPDLYVTVIYKWEIDEYNRNNYYWQPAESSCATKK